MNFLRKFGAKSLKERMTPFISKYGKLTIYTYLGFSAIDLAAWYIVVSRGVDVKKLINMFGIKVDEEKFKKSSAVGNFMIALVIHKANIPIRLPLTLACVPAIARVLGKVPK